MLKRRCLSVGLLYLYREETRFDHAAESKITSKVILPSAEVRLLLSKYNVQLTSVHANKRTEKRKYQEQRQILFAPCRLIL